MLDIMEICECDEAEALARLRKADWDIEAVAMERYDECQASLPRVSIWHADSYEIESIGMERGVLSQWDYNAAY